MVFPFIECSKRGIFQSAIKSQEILIEQIRRRLIEGLFRCKKVIRILNVHTYFTISHPLVETIDLRSKNRQRRQICLSHYIIFLCSSLARTSRMHQTSAADIGRSMDCVKFASETLSPDKLTNYLIANKIFKEYSIFEIRFLLYVIDRAQRLEIYACNASLNFFIVFTFEFSYNLI